MSSALVRVGPVSPPSSDEAGPSAIGTSVTVLLGVAAILVVAVIHLGSDHLPSAASIPVNSHMGWLLMGALQGLVEAGPVLWLAAVIYLAGHRHGAAAGCARPQSSKAPNPAPRQSSPRRELHQAWLP